MTPRRLAASAALALAPLALAQPVAPNRPALNQPSGALPSRFTKIEQTVGDVDPLGVSLRHLSTDLRVPSDFRDVYRIEGSAAAAQRWGVSNPTGADLFARRDGAITAVFPESVYVSTRNGILPLIPPGTIFFIGDLPQDPFGSLPPSPDSPNRVDTRVDTRIGAVGGDPFAASNAPRRTPEPSARPTDPQPTPPSIMTDEPTRRKTVRNLILKAADEPPKPKAPKKPEAPATPERASDARPSDANAPVAPAPANEKPSDKQPADNAQPVRE